MTETRTAQDESRGAALARLYDLDLSEDPGDVDLYLAMAARAGGPIVELAVGSGRVAVPLARAGHEVVGIDRDPAMLERARRRIDRQGRLELVEGDVLRPPRDADRGRFRLAILALNSILLFADPGDQARLVQAMADLLAPGGVAVIDAWQPQPIDLVNMDGRLSLEWLRLDPETGLEVTKLASGWYDAATRAVSVTTLFEASEPGGSVTRWTRSDRLRLASADELETWAEDAGLEVERLAGSYDLGPYGSGSDRAILVARKPTGTSRIEPE